MEDWGTRTGQGSRKVLSRNLVRRWLGAGHVADDDGLGACSSLLDCNEANLIRRGSPQYFIQAQNQVIRSVACDANQMRTTAGFKSLSQLVS